MEVLKVSAKSDQLSSRCIGRSFKGTGSAEMQAIAGLKPGSKAAIARGL